MREIDVLARLEPVAVDTAIITWGGTGNHRLLVELPGKRQVTFEILGPFMSGAAEVWMAGPLEPLDDWSKLLGIQPNPNKPGAGDGK